MFVLGVCLYGLFAKYIYIYTYIIVTFSAILWLCRD